MMEFARAGISRFGKDLAFVATLAAVLGAVSVGSGYMFTTSDYLASFHVTHQRRVLWDPAVWPPGATLSVALAEEGWGEIAAAATEQYPSDFHTVEDAKRALDHALTKWSAVERADIRWMVDTIAPRDQLQEHQGIVVVADDAGFRGTAAARWDFVNGQRLIRSCVITMNNTISWRRDWFDHTLMHELGHCLNLDHTASHPHDREAAFYFGFAAGFFDLSDERRRRSPVWGPYSLLDALDTLPDRVPTLDDETGASVARPRAGWLEETGSIWGAVFFGSEPARGFYVLASRIAPETGEVGAGVGAFTDRFGAYVIEGLDPGAYTLWVFDEELYRPLKLASIPHLRWVGLEGHIVDTIWSAPVVVKAGQRTGPLLIPARRPEAGE